MVKRWKKRNLCETDQDNISPSKKRGKVASVQQAEIVLDHNVSINEHTAAQQLFSHDINESVEEVQPLVINDYVIDDPSSVNSPLPPEYFIEIESDASLVDVWSPQSTVSNSRSNTPPPSTPLLTEAEAEIVLNEIFAPLGLETVLNDDGSSNSVDFGVAVDEITPSTPPVQPAESVAKNLTDQLTPENLQLLLNQSSSSPPGNQNLAVILQKVQATSANGGCFLQDFGLSSRDRLDLLKAVMHVSYGFDSGVFSPDSSYVDEGPNMSLLNSPVPDRDYAWSNGKNSVETGPVNYTGGNNSTNTLIPNYGALAKQHYQSDDMNSYQEPRQIYYQQQLHQPASAYDQRSYNVPAPSMQNYDNMVAPASPPQKNATYSYAVSNNAGFDYTPQQPSHGGHRYSNSNPHNYQDTTGNAESSRLGWNGNGSPQDVMYASMNMGNYQHVIPQQKQQQHQSPVVAPYQQYNNNTPATRVASSRNVAGHLVNNNIIQQQAVPKISPSSVQEARKMKNKNILPKPEPDVITLDGMCYCQQCQWTRYQLWYRHYSHDCYCSCGQRNCQEFRRVMPPPELLNQPHRS